MVSVLEEGLLDEIERAQDGLDRSVVVALDGASGAGKSTLAERLKRKARVAHVPLDDFYQTQIPESELLLRTVEERLEAVFEWDRVRVEALDPLRGRRPGRWHAFDFARGLTADGTYALQDEVTEVGPAPIVLLEGSYSASPPVRDLVDLAVLLVAQREARHRRTAVREGRNPAWLAEWHTIWDDVETHYFEEVCPPGSFDLVLFNGRRLVAESGPAPL